MEREITSILESGENSFVEFKEASVSPQTIAEEIVAFSNVRGGHIFIGVTDEGSVSGIDPSRKKELEETVMNICRTSIIPPVVPLYENIKIGRDWIAKITTPEGLEIM